MKKKWIVLALFAALLGALSVFHGCGRSDGNAPGAVIFGGIS